MVASLFRPFNTIRSFVPRACAAGSAARFFSTPAETIPNKVAVLGAAGGIGQPLSLLLKAMPEVEQLSLYDIVNTPGVAADLSHICTPNKVTGHVGKEELGACLSGSEVVVIPAGVPRKPGMTRDDLFNINATIVFELAEACAKYCPDANILVIANPVNSTVPIVAEVMKRHGVFNPQKLFGVTTLDVVRAKTFIGNLKGLNPVDIEIPVIGGHSGVTIVPVLSQVKPEITFTQEEVGSLTHRIQFGGDEVVQAKAGTGSATLSMAYAAMAFVQSLMSGLAGTPNVITPAYVYGGGGGHVDSSAIPFFSSNVTLGGQGVSEIHQLGPMNDYEKKLMTACIPELIKNINKGVEFVASK